jgi:hypothetical protein
MTLLRHSEYVNTSFAGVTLDGLPFAFVAGKHEAGFPYDTPESEWDELLFLLGDRAGAASAKDLAGLTIHHETERDEGPGHITFHGHAGALDVALDLHFTLRGEERHPLAKPFGLHGRDIPGMAWKPHALLGDAPASTLVVDGVTHPLATFFGELEHAYLTAVAGSRLGVVYDYVCVATADGGAPYAFLDFTGRALRPHGVIGHLYDSYLRETASRTLTLSPRGIEDGNPRGVVLPPHTAPQVVLVSDDVDLGYARLARQLVSFSDPHGRRLVGLREIFTPSPSLPPY